MPVAPVMTWGWEEGSRPNLKTETSSWKFWLPSPGEPGVRACPRLCEDSANSPCRLPCCSPHLCPVSIRQQCSASPSECKWASGEVRGGVRLSQSSLQPQVNLTFIVPLACPSERKTVFKLLSDRELMSHSGKNFLSRGLVNVENLIALSEVLQLV